MYMLVINLLLYVIFFTRSSFLQLICTDVIFEFEFVALLRLTFSEATGVWINSRERSHF